MSLESVLNRWFPYKSIGWKEIGETFIRWTLLRTPWFQIYLHKLIAPQWHPQCHDHPWAFVTFILAGGYWEWANNVLAWRGPGTVLYRPAEFSHNVVTHGQQTAWSIIFATKKSREWGFQDCGDPVEAQIERVTGLIECIRNNNDRQGVHSD